MDHTVARIDIANTEARVLIKARGQGYEILREEDPSGLDRWVEVALTAGNVQSAWEAATMLVRDAYLGLANSAMEQAHVHPGYRTYPVAV